MIRNDIDVVVLGTKHRHIITSDYLKNVPHSIHYSNDYDLPDGLRADDRYSHLSAVKCLLGHYRCFRGHQEAIASTNKPYILVFEDDAVPNTENWHDIVNQSVSLLDHGYEITSLHGRGYTPKKLSDDFVSLKHDDLTFYGRKDSSKLVIVKGACLAYLLKRETVNKVLSFQFLGCPMDVHLANDYSFCFLYHSPFNHDRRLGSLVEKPK